MDIQKFQTHQANKNKNFHSLRSLVIPLVNYGKALEYHVVSHGDRFIKAAIEFHLLCMLLSIINIAIVTNVDLDKLVENYIEETI